MNSNSVTLILRDLAPADAVPLFYWKNNPETRMNSGSTEEVLWAEHLKWFKGVLADAKGKILRIAEVDGMPIGLVRTAPRQNGEVEIHYTISPEFREQGYGKQMVKMFADENILDRSKIVLPIKKGNKKSERIAMSLGLAQVMGSEQIAEVGQPPIIEWMMPIIGQA